MQTSSARLMSPKAPSFLDSLGAVAARWEGWGAGLRSCRETGCARPITLSRVGNTFAAAWLEGEAARGEPKGGVDRECGAGVSWTEGSERRTVSRRDAAVGCSPERVPRSS